MILLIFSLPLAYSSLERIECNNIWDYDVNTSHNENDIQLQKGELNILYSVDKFRVFTYPDTNLVNILLNDTIIIFKGNLITSAGQFEKIALASYYQVLGTAYLQDTRILENCNIYLLRNESQSLNIHKSLEVAIKNKAKICLVEELLTKITVPYISEFVISANNDENEIQIENEYLLTELHATNLFNSSTQFQSYINHIVDFVLQEVINHLKKNHNEMIRIPNIDERFKVGSGIFETNGRFITVDGYFSDLTTLQRTTDAVLDPNGKKFSASCGFGLTKALIQYSQYRLKFGIIKLDGVISAKIDGISIEAKVSVDYNSKPCKTTMEYFKILDYGKITINVTGLSPFNSLASSLATWISKKWENEIIEMIKSKITKIIVYELDKFDCEKFRF